MVNIVTNNPDWKAIHYDNAAENYELYNPEDCITDVVSTESFNFWIFVIPGTVLAAILRRQIFIGYIRIYCIYFSNVIILESYKIRLL